MHFDIAGHLKFLTLVPGTELKILDEYSGMPETMALVSQICEGDTSRPLCRSRAHCAEHVYPICAYGGRQFFFLNLVILHPQVSTSNAVLLECVMPVLLGLLALRIDGVGVF